MPHVRYTCNCCNVGYNLHEHLVDLNLAKNRGVFINESTSSSSSSSFALDLRDSIKGSLLSMFIGDSLSSPLHWVYNSSKLEELKREILDGGIKTFLPGNAINGIHPDSYKYFSRCNPIIQPVRDIFGGNDSKLEESWKTPGTPYHNTLDAGENTLTARLVAHLCNHIVDNKGLDIEKWLSQSYIPTLIRSDMKNSDTWVDETHRVFIRNLSKGAHPFEAGMDDLCLTGIAICVPLLFAYSANRDECEIAIRTLLQLTHKNEDGVLQALAWGDLLRHIISPHLISMFNTQSIIPALNVKDAITCAFESFSEGRNNLDEVMSRGLTDLEAYHGPTVVFSSR
jgi:hypothetical protein